MVSECVMFCNTHSIVVCLTLSLLSSPWCLFTLSLLDDQHPRTCLSSGCCCLVAYVSDLDLCPGEVSSPSSCSLSVLMCVCMFVYARALLLVSSEADSFPGPLSGEEFVLLHVVVRGCCKLYRLHRPLRLIWDLGY